MRNDLHILVKPDTKKALNQFKALLEVKNDSATRITTDEAIKYLLELAKKEFN